MPGQVVPEVGELAGADDDLVVVGTEERTHPPRPGQLVVRRVGEARRVGRDPRALPDVSGERHDEAAVQTTREVRPDRYVGDESGPLVDIERVCHSYC